MGRCMLFSTEFAPQRRRRQPCDFGAWFCGLYWKRLRVASRTQHQINAKHQHRKRHSHQSACACGGCCGIHANANITRDDGCWQCKKGYKREIVMWQYASCRREKGTKYQDWHATRPTHSFICPAIEGPSDFSRFCTPRAQLFGMGQRTHTVSKFMGIKSSSHPQHIPFFLWRRMYAEWERTREVHLALSSGFFFRPIVK